MLERGYVFLVLSLQFNIEEAALPQLPPYFAIRIPSYAYAYYDVLTKYIRTRTFTLKALTDRNRNRTLFRRGLTAPNVSQM